MPGYRGLTWDHPRGRRALEVAAVRARSARTLDLRWDVQPLEGFESNPVHELADSYDLIVLDHPHLGDAREHHSLVPLDTLFEPAEVSRWAAQAVGPAQRSYAMCGHVWALPLDVATQVAAFRADMIDTPPATWGEVAALAATGAVALSLAGPHALLTFSSLCVALGEEPATSAERYVSRDVGLRALTVLREIARRAPAGSDTLNPIAMLEAMASSNTIAYCPLIYGYVTYAMRGRRVPLNFIDAPAVIAGGRPGSTIGGTGLAVSTRAEPSAALLDHLRWLLEPRTQRGFIPNHAGQPSAAAAWDDERLNAASGNFYRATRRTVESSWVRPRYAGYIGFQSAAAAHVRDVLAGHRDPGTGLEAINALHAEAARRASTASTTTKEPAAFTMTREGRPL